MKTCSGCKEHKDPTDFYKDTYANDGLDHYCKPCRSERSRRNERTPEQRAKQREKSKRFRDRHPDYQRKYQLKRKYGLTLDELEDLKHAQGNRCAICGTDEKTLVVDHDHATGEVRGLLCSGCNVGIGMLGDDLTGLQRAINYLT